MGGWEINQKYRCLEINELKSGAFTLSTIRYADRHLIMKWRNEQIYHLRQKQPLSSADQDKYFSETISQLFDNPNPGQILFSLMENGRSIGYGGLVHIDWVDRNAEISFVMDTALEKDRFVELWKVFLDFIKEIGFRYLDFNKIFTYAYDLRPKLYLALEESGFLLEAKLVNHKNIDQYYVPVFIHSFQKPIYYKYHFKQAQSHDAMLLFKWANDPDVRANAINTESIQLENHLAWFIKKLNSPFTHIFIYNNPEGQPIGQIRIDYNPQNETYETDYSLDHEYRGKGMGYKMFSDWLEQFHYRPIRARVKKSNYASQRIFEKLNFKLFETSNNSDYFDNRLE